jgi:hypothetical protein
MLLGHTSFDNCRKHAVCHASVVNRGNGRRRGGMGAPAQAFEGAIMDFKQKLMACTALLGAWLLVPATAGAQSASEKIERLERQTELLQRQLKELQAELAQTRKKTERVEAKVEAAPARPAAAPAGTVFTKGPPAPPPPDRVKVTLGGFIAAESVWRQHNMVNDIGTAFATTPYPFSPLYNEHEFHGTARQSRISLLVEGNIDPYQKLSGYYESDFLGVGNTSNYNQSNSWAPRLRHAYFTYDNTGWGGLGFHILAGQTWTLATQNQVDMTPRKENIPLTIDSNYVVGFNYLRQWQIRGVVDVAPGIALGASVENPAAIVGASTATAPLGLGGAFASGGIVNGQVVNFVNTGGGGDFLQTVNVTADQAPDIIEKAAFDPGWGHYEIYGLQRFFSDNVLRCAVGACVAGSTTMVGTADNKTTFGAGVGGSVLLPLIPKYLEFTANGLYGRGVGRYGAGQLPDVTIAADGSLSLVTGWSAMVGLIGHPWEGLDLYVYAGQEEVAANFFNIGTTLFGLGNPGFSNATCLVTTPFSFSGGTPTDCIANNKRLSEITAGFWQNVYKGDYGRVTVGAQYEYIKRKSFAGIGGDVSTDNNVVMTSVRYYPF